jgi:D-alanyl-D-alanine carboxypeptidase (penicillin-binding protein 5/6)
MNKIAHKMGLKKTKFSNPTGLSDPNNYSTAHDIALMVSFCMKNHLMRSIFKKKVYICEAKN